MKTKYCKKGEHYVNISKFGILTSSKDGLSHNCKDCVQKYKRELYAFKTNKKELFCGCGVKLGLVHNNRIFCKECKRLENIKITRKWQDKNKEKDETRKRDWRIKNKKQIKIRKTKRETAFVENQKPKKNLLKWNNELEKVWR